MLYHKLITKNLFTKYNGKLFNNCGLINAKLYLKGLQSMSNIQAYV